MVTFQQGAKTIPQFLWRFREEFQIDCTFQELVMRDLRTIAETRDLFSDP